ncbi:hypothetical protein GCM10020219_022700 [Nonomuraea dietziae]
MAEVHSELEEARREAVLIRDKAQSDAGEIVRSRRWPLRVPRRCVRRVEEESRILKNELKELRSDLERRESRLAERGAAPRRGGAQRRSNAPGSWPRPRRSWQTGARSCCRSRVSAGAILERVAGLTSEQAKSELVREIENQAKREAALIVREIEGEAPQGGREAGHQDRDAGRAAHRRRSRRPSP